MHSLELCNFIHLNKFIKYTGIVNIVTDFVFNDELIQRA